MDHSFKYGGRLLDIAADGGCFNMVKHLKNAGASIDIQDNRGKSALHRAIEHGDKEAIQCLLANGSDINVGTETAQDTALYLAVTRGRVAFYETNAADQEKYI